MASSRNIQAGEVGRAIVANNLGVDWADLGYTLKLWITKQNSGITNTYDMSAVPAQPLQAQLVTTEDMFPTAASYRVQVVAYDGVNPTLRSSMATIVVLDND